MPLEAEPGRYEVFVTERLRAQQVHPVLARVGFSGIAKASRGLSEKQRKIAEKRIRVVGSVPMWMPPSMEHIEPLVEEPFFVIRDDLLVPPLGTTPDAFTAREPTIELLIDPLAM